MGGSHECPVNIGYCPIEDIQIMLWIPNTKTKENEFATFDMPDSEAHEGNKVG